MDVGRDDVGQPAAMTIVLMISSAVRSGGRAAGGHCDASHLDWIYGSVLDVFGIFAGHRDAAVRICEALVDSPDQLCAWVLANSATG